LRDGGATVVAIDDQHATGVQNTLAEQLPDWLEMTDPHELYGQQQRGELAFDAVFQIGRHARHGTPNAFVPHTMLPGMAVAINRAPVTECHIFAWRAGLPLIGITGDDALATQIDGMLSGTPYLAVKRSLGRTNALPVYPDRAHAQAALRQFARDCARSWRERPAPVLPAPSVLSARLTEPALARAAGSAGLAETGSGELSVEVQSWWGGGEAALGAVMGCIAGELFGIFAGLELSSAEAMAANDPARLEQSRWAAAAVYEHDPLD
jgi:D-aminopeptidase